MSSPELLRKQIDRWLEKRRSQAGHVDTDLKTVEQELAKCRNEVDRYKKAYGAGLFSIEELKDYTLSVRERIASLESERTAATANGNAVAEFMLPDKRRIEDFSQGASAMLKVLKFTARQTIVRGVIEKVVAADGVMSVTGRIPVRDGGDNSNVALCSTDMYGANTIRHAGEEAGTKHIPFAFRIKLPPPGSKRIGMSCSPQGWIVRSKAA